MVNSWQLVKLSRDRVMAMYSTPPKQLNWVLRNDVVDSTLSSDLIFFIKLYTSLPNKLPQMGAWMQLSFCKFKFKIADFFRPTLGQLH